MARPERRRPPGRSDRASRAGDRHGAPPPHRRTAPAGPPSDRQPARRSASEPTARAPRVPARPVGLRPGGQEQLAGPRRLRRRERHGRLRQRAAATPAAGVRPPRPRPHPSSPEPSAGRAARARPPARDDDARLDRRHALIAVELVPSAKTRASNGCGAVAQVEQHGRERRTGVRAPEQSAAMQDQPGPAATPGDASSSPTASGPAAASTRISRPFRAVRQQDRPARDGGRPPRTSRMAAASPAAHRLRGADRDPAGGHRQGQDSPRQCIHVERDRTTAYNGCFVVMDIRRRSSRVGLV